MNRITAIYLFVFVLSVLGFSVAEAQTRIAEQAYLIFEQSCLNCHGPHGTFTEQLVIQSSEGLIDSGVVIPGNPEGSEFYQRLIETAVEKRMPLGQPPLPPAAIQTIREWIQAGAPDWNAFASTDIDFIGPQEMLQTIEDHINALAPFDRSFARYFTSTHLYNAGETTETLRAYQRALSKLVNSLSWGRAVTQPQPIDPQATIFYIDLRDYEWEIGSNRWTQIEDVYPYGVEFNAPTQTRLRQKLADLRQEMDCEVPFVHVDWFLATASLPPLYHDILDLPGTDRALEERLEVNVVENIRNAAGKRVWRAGFNDSGVSNHNRVVERHVSRYGAYWKSYDFAGSAEKQNIFTHPLSFEHDGGEIIFNLPNGLQAYYLADAGGRRLDAAPIKIVSNPAASDPTVRNGLSCIGCHTEGMKDFEDQVRGVVKQNPNPPFDKDRALRLYTEEATMDALLDEDTARYRQALEAAGGILGGIEPVQRFYEAFWRPLAAEDAAAAVGLETSVFLKKIQQNVGLKNLGLLVLENGAIKRDAWTSKYTDILAALDFPSRIPQTDDTQEEIIPGTTVHIPDPNLRAVIAETLGKARGAQITAEEMATLERLRAENKGISDLTGLAFAKNLAVLLIGDNPLSDLSPLASLENLREILLQDTEVSDLSPLASLRALEVIDASATRITSLAALAGLKNLQKLDTVHSDITDLSPLAGLTNLTRLRLYDVKATDLSPLKGLTKLKWFGLTQTDNISNFAALSGLTDLEHLDLADTEISDVSALSGLVNLETLNLAHNRIVDVSPLASLPNLKDLQLHENNISDFSPLDRLRQSVEVFTWFGNPGFPQGGPNIEGPWLWLTLPVDRREGDHLAQVSNGKSTEEQMATFGAAEGSRIGNNVWSTGMLEPYHPKNSVRDNLTNLRRLLDSQGVIEPNIYGQKFVVYGSLTLYALRTQQTQIFIGASNDQKVYLNGTLVHEDYTNYSHGEHNIGYRTFFPITLQKGKNVLLVRLEELRAQEDLWSLFFGFQPDTEYKVFNPRVGDTFSKSKIHVGDTFILDLNAEDVIDLAGWQFDIAFDPAVLEAIEVNEGDFLKEGGGSTFFQKGRIDNATGKITKMSAARLGEDGVTGTGGLLSVTFTAKTPGQTQLKLENFQLAAITGEAIPVGVPEILITVEGQLATGDVNRDGQVSILDIVLVARQIGKTVSANSEVDVNGDGVISILDLIIVASHLGESTAAATPAMLAQNNIHDFNSAMIQTWIEQAQLEDDGSVVFQDGITYLQRLLASLIPEQTALLANYPNPFNPETWIPYQLAEAGEVEIVISDMRGIVIRRLRLRHQPAGDYTDRHRAAYWDGRNALGERVASGLYFYTLVAGDFSATRKMLILK